jgi:hypothetical protein
VVIDVSVSGKAASASTGGAPAGQAPRMGRMF